jgi:hypothetical protein
MTRGQKTNLLWISLGAAALLLRALLSASPELIEQYYSRGLFLGIRLFIDYLLAWLPFPLLYLFLPVLLYWVIARLRSWWFKPYGSHWRKAGALLLQLAAFLGGGVFFFLFLWGYNYGRVPLEEQLGLNMQPLSRSQLKKELYEEGARLRALRREIPGLRTASIAEEALPEHLEQLLRESLEAWLQEQGFPAVGKVRGKLIYPKGIFLRFSSSGLYFPWTGEGHVDAGLHPLQKISVMAHELGHGYGFGYEGTCNFLSYLACTRVDDPLIAYAGHLNYWRTLAINYRRFAPDAYKAYRESLPLGIQADLDAINETLLKYPDLMPDLRYKAYDAYLKAQGIEEGIKNYSRVIMLVHAWKESQRI